MITESNSTTKACLLGVAAGVVGAVAARRWLGGSAAAPARPQDAYIVGVGTVTGYSVSAADKVAADLKIREGSGAPDAKKWNAVFKKWVAGTQIQSYSQMSPVFLPPGADPKTYPHADMRVEFDVHTPNNFRPPIHARSQVFEAVCIPAGVEAARRALADWGGNPKDVTHLLITCTSGWLEPGMACAIIKQCGLSNTCAKAELLYNGCFCGAACLRIARDHVRASGGTALVVAIEVASVGYNAQYTTDDDLVAHSLFSDGGGAIVLSATRGKYPWQYVDAGMNIVPDSTKYLGLHPPLTEEEDGPRMILHKDAATVLRSFLTGDGEGVELLKRLRGDLSTPAPAAAVHPGGPAILRSVAAGLQDLAFPATALDDSSRSLYTVGNLGCAALVFILARRLQQNTITEDRMMTLAFGPGITMEWASLQRV